MSDDQGRVVAKTITVDGDDLETAQMIEAGLHPTAEQVAANMQAIGAIRRILQRTKFSWRPTRKTLKPTSRISLQTNSIEKNIKGIEEATNRFTALSEYDVKGEATAKFEVGSAKISREDQIELKELANTATRLTGYIIEVTGYADSTGDAAINTKLSEDRARAVVTYLIQQGSVPMRHIVAPGAMGEYGAAAPNETKAGRAENRRVEIKVLVNKGIAGS